jgi:hypothetical protein
MFRVGETEPPLLRLTLPILIECSQPRFEGQKVPSPYLLSNQRHKCIKVEEFPAQPATLVNWSPLYYPNNDINSQSKYIFGILDLFLTRFLDFSNFQAL